MKGKVILICGKICSGKSFYAEKLRKTQNAVLLSCDEITLTLFDEHLGEKHDEICDRTKRYLFGKSLEITEIGCNVILDWGFWQKADRDNARSFYEKHGIPCELHYIDISDKLWKIYIDKRNKAVENKEISAYFIDENLAAKFSSLFEMPDKAEIDIWIKKDEQE